MKKILFFSPLATVLFPFVAAAEWRGMMGNYGQGGGYGMMSGAGLWAGLIGLIYFAIVSFVFSAIFWCTKHWVDKGLFVSSSLGHNAK